MPALVNAAKRPHTSPYQITDIDRPLGVCDRATQIRHLAIMGFAARESVWNAKDLNEAYLSLFEVIARLAAEIEDETKEEPTPRATGMRETS